MFSLEERVEPAMSKKGKVEIDREKCKSCGYCVEHCPQSVLKISENYNDKGYFYAEQVGEECTGCSICAVVCPEAIIEVWRG